MFVTYWAFPKVFRQLLASALSRHWQEQVEPVGHNIGASSSLLVVLVEIIVSCYCSILILVNSANGKHINCWMTVGGGCSAFPQMRTQRTTLTVTVVVVVVFRSCIWTKKNRKPAKLRKEKYYKSWKQRSKKGSTWKKWKTTPRNPWFSWQSYDLANCLDLPTDFTLAVLISSSSFFISSTSTHRCSPSVDSALQMLHTSLTHL